VIGKRVLALPHLQSALVGKADEGSSRSQHRRHHGERAQQALAAVRAGRQVVQRADHHQQARHGDAKTCGHQDDPADCLADVAADRGVKHCHQGSRKQQHQAQRQAPLRRGIAHGANHECGNREPDERGSKQPQGKQSKLDHRV
jgi:hypothetical protein